MKFANLVAVSSIQRIQTGGLLSLLSFFPCRGPYISFWSLVRPGPRLTDFYCLILSRLLANMQLRLDTLSSSHNYFCGNTKPVSHVGTSTVSDSEALIHLAYVQHMWQSKFVVILEGLTRWRIELC